MPASSGVLAQEEQQKNQKEVYQPSQEWLDMINFHRSQLMKAKQARNSPDRKLDNQTFINDFYSNEDAKNSYLRPKRNDDEVRVVGGTTEKRVESIINELESMNVQHEVQAYYRNDALIWGLGKAMEDCVTRTKHLENDEEVIADAINELVSQRAVFVEEILEEKRVGNAYIRQCKKRVRSAIEVIIGDPTMPAYLLQEQPFIALYDRMSLRTAKMFWGDRKNWPHVRGGQDLSADVYGNEITFRMGILASDEVEVIRYMSVPDNEYQTYINGVPMDEPGTKLPFQYPFPRYPLACAIPKSMGHHTFYGRSVASAMKYLQALNDETVRNIVRKFRQAIEPPRAVQSQDRIYTRDMYNAGKISYGVNVDSLKPLTTHSGVTDAETTVMSMIRSMQDEMASRSDLQLGSQPNKKQSATAVVEQQKQAVKMLGQLVLAVNSLVRQMTENRIYNIIETFSEPEGSVYDPALNEFVDEYKRFTLKDQPFEDGSSGDKIIQFVGRDLTSKEHQAIDKWEKSQEEDGKPTRLTAINIKKLRNMAVNWFVTTSSKPKDNDDLHKLMFEDKLSQAGVIAQTTGRQLNGERVVNEWEQAWRAKDWFKEQQESTPPPPQEGEQPLSSAPGEAAGAGGPPSGSGMAGDLTNGIRAGVRKPIQMNPQNEMKAKSLVGAV